MDISPIEIAEQDMEIFGIILAQKSLKQGMKEFGREKANESIIKKFRQLHN